MQTPEERRPRHGLLPALLLGAMLVSGCASWDNETYFPADYQDTFTKVHNCRRSTHPTGDYVVVWINDVGRDAFFARKWPLPEGTVLVKTQYTDSACSRLVRYTAMRKEAANSAPARGDWGWQLVDDQGGVRDCCDGGDPQAPRSCVGCHAPCVGSDRVCTSPQ